MPGWELGSRTPKHHTPQPAPPKGESFAFCYNTVKGREIGQFSFFKSHLLFTPQRSELSLGLWHSNTLSFRPSGQVPSFVFKHAAVSTVSLLAIKTLTKVNLDLLYQVQAAFYFLLFYLNFQRIENSSCHFLPRSLLKYLILPQAVYHCVAQGLTSIFEESLFSRERQKMLFH